MTAADSTLASHSVPVAHSASEELRALLRTAAPLVLANLGNMALGLVDVAVVGRLGERSIAAAGLGNAVFFTTTLFGLGVLFGLDPLLGQAVGAGEHDRARKVLAAGLQLALLVGVPLALVIVLVAALLPASSIPADVVPLAQDFLVARMPSLVPFLALMATRAYLQATGNARSLVEGVVVANLVNLPLATALVLGVPAFGPFPAIDGLGVIGAGLAASLATLVQLAVSIRPVLGDAAFRTRAAWGFDRALVTRAATLGAPIGAQVVAEAGSFSLVTFLVGGFGTRPLSAHQIALTLVSTTFQVALGVGAATSVRVSAAVGRGDREATRRAGLVGIATGTAWMIVGALLIFLMPRELARVLTSEPHVVEAAVPFLFVAGCFQLADGAQTVAQGALRGAGDTRFPLLVNLVGHWAVGVPLGATLAYALGGGPIALWWGLSAGLFAVAFLATARFVVLTRTTVARV